MRKRGKCFLLLGFLSVNLLFLEKPNVKSAENLIKSRNIDPQIFCLESWKWWCVN